MIKQEKLEEIMLFDGWHVNNLKSEDSQRTNIRRSWIHEKHPTILIRNDDDEVKRLIANTHYHDSWDWIHSVWDKLKRIDATKLPKEECDYWTFVQKDRIAEAIPYISKYETIMIIAENISWYNNSIQYANSQKEKTRSSH